MSILIKILFLITGTILVALGAIGLYGVIGLSGTYSDSVDIASQAIIPISLIVVGIYLLVKFYKKPKFKDDTS